MATAGKRCRCQAADLERRDCDLDFGLQPQILSPHCALCAVCMQHAPLFPRFSPPISHHPVYGSGSREECSALAITRKAYNFKTIGIPTATQRIFRPAKYALGAK